MIQRIQSLYILFSVIICIAVFFIPLGMLDSEVPIRFSVCGFFDNEKGELLQLNWLPSVVLTAALLLQLVSVFLFKNRILQSKVVQVDLVLLLLFVVVTLLTQDIFPYHIAGQETSQINYNWTIILTGFPWVLNYLALRAIKKDEGIVRSADRLR